LTLALFVSSLQSCESEAAKSDPNAQTASQNQTSPRSDSQQPNETVVPAASTFSKVFVGTIDDKYAIHMTLERKDADLTGHYFYERAGAFKAFEKKGLDHPTVVIRRENYEDLNYGAA